MFPIPSLKTSVEFPNEKPPPKNEQHIVINITVVPYFLFDTEKSFIVFILLEHKTPMNIIKTKYITIIKISIDIKLTTSLIILLSIDIYSFYVLFYYLHFIIIATKYSNIC